MFSQLLILLHHISVTKIINDAKMMREKERERPWKFGTRERGLGEGKAPSEIGEGGILGAERVPRVSDSGKSA